MRIFVAALALIVLAGCQTKQIEEMSYSEQKTLAQSLVKKCYAQGVKSGTREMDVCMQTEARREVYSRRSSAMQQRRAAAALSRGMANMSSGYYNAATSNNTINNTTTCTRVPSPTGYTAVRCY